MDIAGLTIALLRAAQIPARYVYGAIDAAADFAASGGIPITTVISGGKIAQIRLEHLYAGKTMITHTDAVSIPGGWSGAGYIILDPETNVGAWKIGGGLNGGWYTLVAEAGATILGLIFFHVLLLGPVAIFLFAALMAVTFLAAILAVISGPDFSGYENERELIAFFGGMPLLIAASSYLAIELAFVEAALMLHVLLAEMYVLFGG